MARRKSGRIRRQEAKKRKRNVPGRKSEPTPAPVAPARTTPNNVVPDKTVTAPQMVKPPTIHKTVNFAQDYFHIYRELRNVFVITIFMFAVLAGLSFVI